MNTKARILVLGAGFAALRAVREMRRRAPDADLALIAPRPEFLYWPSLIWIPTGLRTPAQLWVPLERFLARHRVEYIAASVTGFADAGRRVLTDGGEHRNDALLIATGGRFMKRLPGIEHTLGICSGVDDAVSIGERLHALQGGTIACGFAGNPKEPTAMRGGPTFEMLFGIDTWLRRQGRRDRVRLVFFSPAERPGQRLGAKAVERLLAEMRHRGIDTRLGHRLRGFESGAVLTEGGDFEADLILFTPGMCGPAWAVDCGIELSPAGFFPADAHGRVKGLEQVYVAGDAGSQEGPDWLPKQAHMAELQARAAAANLLLELQGKPPVHVPRTELVCIVDSGDSGMLVYRSEKRGFTLPRLRLLHWAKRAFERLYLRGIR